MAEKNGIENQKIIDGRGIKNHLDLLNKTNEKEYSWIKQVLITISALIGLIISIKTEPSRNNIEHVSFVITIVSSGLCILCGLAFLYGDTDIYYSLSKEHAKHIESPENYEDTLIQVAPKKIFGILRGCFFLLLLSTVISLIFYAILLDTPE
jgi:lipopolysaccharide/colanic/teichoic acid biosynthesis glycosyltransferase